MANYTPAGGARRDQPVPQPAQPDPDFEIDEAGDAVEQRVAITLGVSDGFKFGCGLLLAGAAFYFALIMVAATAVLVAMVLGIPLPFGLGR